MEEFRENNTEVASKPPQRKIINIVLPIIFFVLPIIFAPSVLIPFYSIKLSVIVATLVLLTVSLFVAFMKKDQTEIGFNKFTYSVLLFAVIAVISSLFSSAISKSFGGLSVEMATSLALSILVLSFFVVYLQINERKTLRLSIFALFASSVVTLVYVLFRILVVKGILPSGIGAFLPDNPVGSLIDVSIFLSLGVIASVALTMQDVLVSKKAKICTLVFTLLSMLFVGAVHFSPLMLVMLGISLVYLVSMFVKSKRQNIALDKHLFVTGILVFVLSLSFFILPDTLNQRLANVFAINSIEVNPSIVAMVDIAKSVFKSDPLLGGAPNQFAEVWALYKSPDTNLTQFWNTDFSFGSGFLPTLVVLTGLLGGVALTVFFVGYVWHGTKIFRRKDGVDEEWKKLATVSFVSSLLLWVMTFFYTPSIVLVFIAFVMTAFFLRSSGKAGIINENKMVISGESSSFRRYRFIMVALVVLVAIITWSFSVKTFALMSFQKGVSVLNTSQDIESAKNYILRANSISRSDVYDRALSEIYLTEVLNIMYEQSENINNGNITTELQQSIQDGISRSVASAESAISYNSADFRNHLTLARVYDVLASNGIQGAPELAKVKYDDVLRYNPTYPAAYLGIAKMEALLGNLEAARGSISKSLEMKPNYTDAHFSLAQLEALSDNLPAAVTSVENAVRSEPNNPAIWFQLGLLYYNLERWQDTAMALEQSIVLVPDYANAKYFLGLALERLGRNSDAIKQFEDIEKTNPENEEVKFILSNLRTGRNPFDNAQPPIDDNPEGRPDLPIEEN